MKKNKFLFSIVCFIIISIIFAGILISCNIMKNLQTNNNQEVVLFNGDKVEIASKNYTNTVYAFNRNNINIHLDCMTSDDNEIIDNILLVHGLTYSSHEFDVDYQDYSLVRFLCDNGYAVWRIDIAGYGQSEEIEDGFLVDSKYAADDIIAAIDRIISITKAETIDLLGWSWGTVTSSFAVEKRFEVIDKLVLYAPILTGIGKADIKNAFNENTWENAVSDFQLDENGMINEEIVDKCVVSMYCSNCWKYDGAMSPNGGRRDLCVATSSELINLFKIKNPTLIIYGNNDPYLNMPLVEKSLDKLPENSKLVMIDGGGHALLMEKPYYHKFQQNLIEFLK